MISPCSDSTLFVGAVQYAECLGPVGRALVPLIPSRVNSVRDLVHPMYGIGGLPVNVSLASPPVPPVNRTGLIHGPSLSLLHPWYAHPSTCRHGIVSAIKYAIGHHDSS